MPEASFVVIKCSYKTPCALLHLLCGGGIILFAPTGALYDIMLL